MLWLSFKKKNRWFGRENKGFYVQKDTTAEENILAAHRFVKNRIDFILNETDESVRLHDALNSSLIDLAVKLETK